MTVYQIYLSQCRPNLYNSLNPVTLVLYIFYDAFETLLRVPQNGDDAGKMSKKHRGDASIKQHDAATPDESTKI